MTKKVLIITYYWPPAGGPGVQRVLKFAKYLPEFGWEPIILTVKNGDYPAIDESLEKDIPPTLKVFKTKTLEPFTIYKLLTGGKKSDKIDTYVLKRENKSLIHNISVWIRNNLFIPDARIGWYPFAVKAAKRIIIKEKPDIILSSSPPHSLQLVAKKISRKYNLPWVEDLRDPWEEIAFNQGNKRTQLAKYLDSKLELSTFKNAQSIVTISNDIANTIKHKSNNNNCHVIYNGYDFETEYYADQNKDLTIVYSGTIGETRIPYAFLEAAQQFIGRETSLKIKFVGFTCDKLREEVDRLELNNYVDYLGYVTNSESIKELQNASVLLLIIDNVPNNKGIVTGKVFEYIGCKKPILAIGNTVGDASKILEEYDCGKMFDYADVDGILEYLELLNASMQNNSKLHTFKNSDSFSRKNLTKKLADILNKTTKWG